MPERPGKTGANACTEFPAAEFHALSTARARGVGRPVPPGRGGGRCPRGPAPGPGGGDGSAGGPPGGLAGVVPGQVGGIPGGPRGRSGRPDRGGPEIRRNAVGPGRPARVVIRAKLCSSGDDRPLRIPSPPVRGRLLVRDDVRSGGAPRTPPQARPLRTAPGASRRRRPAGPDRAHPAFTAAARRPPSSGPAPPRGRRPRGHPRGPTVRPPPPARPCRPAPGGHFVAQIAKVPIRPPET